MFRIVQIACFAMAPALLAGCVTNQCIPPRTQCVAVCEEVPVPVYAARRAPNTCSAQVPRYVWREEPVYREQQVPIYGMKSVPVFVDRQVPVTIGAYDPCQCKEVDARLFSRAEPWQVGIRRERAIVGYRTEKICCGVRKIRVQEGWDTQTTTNGCKEEWIQVGVRPERRITGYRQEPLPGCP